MNGIYTASFIQNHAETKRNVWCKNNTQMHTWVEERYIGPSVCVCIKILPPVTESGAEKILPVMCQPSPDMSIELTQTTEFSAQVHLQGFFNSINKC